MLGNINRHMVIAYQGVGFVSHFELDFINGVGKTRKHFIR